MNPLDVVQGGCGSVGMSTFGMLARCRTVGIFVGLAVAEQKFGRAV